MDGALGKIAQRGKSAPKPALQVSPSEHHEAVNATGPEAALLSKSIAAGGSRTGTGAALTHRQALLALEKVYTHVLDLEQIKRTQPQMASYVTVAPADATDLEDVKQLLADSQTRYEEVSKMLWDSTKVSEPLDVSNPHPFISIMNPSKGKRILPRVLRHTTSDQTLTVFLLFLATFSTIDVVQQAPLLDQPRPGDSTSPLHAQRADLETSLDAFINNIAKSFSDHLAKQQLRVVAGLLGVFIERNDIVLVAKSPAGLTFLTHFLTRGQDLKKLAGTEDPELKKDEPDQAQLDHW